MPALKSNDLGLQALDLFLQFFDAIVLFFYLPVAWPHVRVPREVISEVWYLCEVKLRFMDKLVRK